MNATDTGRSVTPRELQPCKSSQRSSACTADRHGETAGYRKSYGCTCPAAVADARRWDKAWRLRKARGQSLRCDATGTRRRVQALVANGWTMRDIGARLGGITPTAVSYLTKRPRVHIDTAKRVRVLYDEIADVTGPSHKSAVRAQNWGWLPPLWWDDDTIDDPSYVPPSTVAPVPIVADVDLVAVERAIEGDRSVTLTRAERQAAFDELRRRHTLGASCQRLGISGTTGQRLEAVRTRAPGRDTADDLEETG